MVGPTRLFNFPGEQVNGTHVQTSMGPNKQEGAAGEADTGLPSAMLELTLGNTITAIRSTLAYLEGPLKPSLEAALHDNSRLPDSKHAQLAAEAIDLMHKFQMLLEPGPLILADHFLGYASSKCLNAAVESGVPDILARRPATLEQLSEASETRADRLGQVLRVLCNNGIFEYDEKTGLYRNNHTSSLLCTDHWMQWHNWVRLYGNQFYDIARGIPAAVKKDATKSAAQINFDTDSDMFTYFQQQGWMPLLHRTLGGGAIAMAPGILEDYPWHEVADETVMDVGGGGGGLVAALLRRFSNMRGAIIDLPDVIAHTRSLFHGDDGTYNDVSDRVTPPNLVAGDFFKNIPSFAVYTIKWCLHDWKDPEAIAILANIRRAILPGPNSRLVVMESVLANGRSQRLSRYGDMNMMMTTNGQERTEKQWRELAAHSGWEIVAIHTLRNSWVKALDFRPTSKGYVMGHDDAEVRRLRAQHEWIRASMGSLIHAPIDHKKQNMRILDSGTADGCWLTDLAASLPESTAYVGTDIAVHLFPKDPRPSFTFIEQSVADPWPQEWESSFDFVHQRLVLAACDPATSERAVAALFSMVKPGGWIQLLECDHSGGFTEERKAMYPATVKFGELMLKALSTSGKSGQHGLSLRTWLHNAGAVNIIETKLDCPVGARAATPALKKSTTSNLLNVVQNLKAARKGMPGLAFSDEDFDDLSRQLDQELSSKGSSQRFHLVYGRRPLHPKGKQTSPKECQGV